jgi:hypothetical protein
MSDFLDQSSCSAHDLSLYRDPGLAVLEDLAEERGQDIPLSMMKET